MWPVLKLHSLAGQWLAAKFRTSSMRVLNFFFARFKSPSPALFSPSVLPFPIHSTIPSTRRLLYLRPPIPNTQLKGVIFF